jgi:hypothetical protein
MTTVLKTALALGLLAGAAAPAFADCAGHVSADAKGATSTTTADSGTATPKPAGGQPG